MLLVYFLFFFVFRYLHIWLHEIGHAVIGRFAGYEVTSLGTGRGKVLLAWSWRGVRFFVCRDHFFSGFTFLFPIKDKPAVWAQVLKASGGLIVNFLTACVICLVLRYYPDAVIAWIGLGTVCLCLIDNGIPRRNLAIFFAGDNDAAHIVDILKPPQSSANVSIQSSIASRWALVNFLHGIGDGRSFFDRGVFLAPLLLQWGEIERAQTLLAWMEPMSQRDSQKRLQYALLCVDAASAVGDDQKVREALDSAKALYIGDQKDYFWRALQSRQLDRWIREERLEEALTLIDELSQQYSIESNPQAVIVLLVYRIYVVAGVQGLEAGLQAYHDYLRQRIHFESPQLDLHAAHSLAYAYAEKEEWRSAEPYYRHALALLMKIEYSPRDGSELIKDTQICFERLGCSDDPALAEAKQSQALSQAPRMEQQAAPARDVTQGIWMQRNGGLAFACIFASLLVFVMTRRDDQEIDFGSLLSKFSLAAAFGIVFAYAFGYVSREFRPFAAPIILLMTVLPWIAAALSTYLSSLMS